MTQNAEPDDPNDSRSWAHSLAKEEVCALRGLVTCAARIEEAEMQVALFLLESGYDEMKGFNERAMDQGGTTSSMIRLNSAPREL